MSLRVWLPLTKDLRNQGLSNVTVTNNGATFNSSGKLGGCYSFDGTDDRIYANNVSISNTAMSACCWVKLNNLTSSDYPYIFALGSNTGGTGIQIGLSVWKSDTKIHLVGNGSEPSSGYTPPTNTWIHLCITINGAITKLYVNGVLTSTQTNANTPKTQTCLCLGARSNSTSGAGVAISYPMNGYINDFRLYDHCLSPMEVKELAKGLVLHYPLDRQGWGSENIIAGTDDWSTWYKGARWTANNGILTYSAGSVSWVDADSPCIPWTDVDGKTITVSCEVRSDDFNFTSGSGFSLCFVRKATEAVQNYSNRRRECTPIFVNSANKGQITSDWLKLSATYVNFSDSSFTNTYNGGGGDWFGLYLWNYTDKSIQVRHIKVEIGDKVTSWCPNSSDALATTLGLNGTTEYDCSGFCNNSIRNANTTYSSNTPKYSVSTFWGAVNTPKATLNDASILSSLTNCTVAWWENCTTTGNTLLFSGQTQYYYIGAGNNSNPLYDYNIGTSGITLYKDGVAVNTSYSGKRVNHTGTYHIKDEWHHYVLTGVNLSAWTTFIINGYTSWPLNAYVSDIRIYATALSADDVQSLYQNSAYIDSYGNVYGAVHMEV